MMNWNEKCTFWNFKARYHIWSMWMQRKFLGIIEKSFGESWNVVYLIRRTIRTKKPCF